MTDLLAIHAAAEAKSTRDTVRSYGVRQCLVVLTTKDGERRTGRVNWWGLHRFGFKLEDQTELSLFYTDVDWLVSV